MDPLLSESATLSRSSVGVEATAGTVELPTLPAARQ
jgi:hypothetical protein